MAVDISGLEEYVQMHPELLHNFLREDLTLKRVRTFDITNVTPGKFNARIFMPKALLQACCKRPNNNSNVIERMSEAVCILDGQDYCETDIAQILRDGAQTFTAGGEKLPPSVEGVITEGQIAAFVEALDILTFQGNKLLSDPNLNKIDGLLTIAENEGIVVPPKGTNPYELVKNTIRMIPDIMRKMGPVAIFCSDSFMEAYFDVASSLNLFHYNEGQYTIGQERAVLGKSGIIFIPTRAMAGSNKLLVTPLQNIVWFNSRENDHNTLDWGYDKVDQFFYWRIKTILGVNFVFPEWALVTEYDEAILEGTASTNVTIVSPLSTTGAVKVSAEITNPLADNGGVLTGTTPIAVSSVSVSPSSAGLIVGNTLQLNADILPTNATNKSVTWSSDTPAVASVSTLGVVTALSAGVAVITATTVDGSHTSTSTITVAASRIMPLSYVENENIQTLSDSPEDELPESSTEKNEVKQKSRSKPKKDTESEGDDVLNLINEINKDE